MYWESLSALLIGLTSLGLSSASARSKVRPA